LMNNRNYMNTVLLLLQACVSYGWRLGLVVACWPRSTKLLYAGPI